MTSQVSPIHQFTTNGVHTVTLTVATDCGTASMSLTVDVLVGTEFLRGDIDGNGVVFALTDALALLDFQFSGGTPPPCADAADVDDDGAVYLRLEDYRSAEHPDELDADVLAPIRAAMGS